MANFMKKFLPKGNDHLLITPATIAGAKTTEAVKRAIKEISAGSSAERNKKATRMNNFDSRSPPSNKKMIPAL